MHNVSHAQVVMVVLRFHWTHHTSYAFLRTKMEMFECSEQTLEELERFEE